MKKTVALSPCLAWSTTALILSLSLSFAASATMSLADDFKGGVKVDFKEESTGADAQQAEAKAENVEPDENTKAEAPKQDREDAAFVGIAAAAGSGAGVAAVAATAFTVVYIYVQISRLFGPSQVARFWQINLVGVSLVVLSLVAIPLGAAFGTWWGAGLRGLPLPLVDASMMMALGLALGASTGAFVLGPAGFVVASLVMGFRFVVGLDGPFRRRQSNLATDVFDYFVFAPVVFGALPLGFVGAVIGAGIGPVLTAAHWGLGAKASYGEE